ncbi:unnamed protein product [Lasius platythorax]|uniref:Uncharacterized protein n=1 Tax=Lasius platythorax TaxID=488582 RepID=A0AAV2NLA9_9HYME
MGNTPYACKMVKYWNKRRGANPNKLNQVSTMKKKVNLGLNKFKKQREKVMKNTKRQMRRKIYLGIQLGVEDV